MCVPSRLTDERDQNTFVTASHTKCVETRTPMLIVIWCPRYVGMERGVVGMERGVVGTDRSVVGTERSIVGMERMKM